MLIFFANPILIAAAVIPALVLLRYVYKADKLDRESPQLLISLVLTGVIATFCALVAERIGTRLLSRICGEQEKLYKLLLYFVVVAGSEEGFKYLLLRRRTWNSPEFNCQFDGVVYAVFVSLGFALWENLSYVLMYGFGTAMVRAITAVPGHACFGVFMGAWYGLAKRYEGLGRTAACARCKRLAFLLPAFMHGCYDYIAAIEYVHYAWVFVGFIAIMFVLAWQMVRRMSRNDRYIHGR